ncbi:hypothetical protein IE077_002882 [Cardiosporidium cionae]|uniref:Proteasome assembly chaperone 4 n=1 Tax=Cardiosporidium cionae TaxID=476202 RepID=A0ABQ7J460_9APIC|nr:hypothetical protein IE077_002882 [Cardiosporidium cionae]|eukprot:KAF8817912.1 hypothetical protein IE077_002882 [Cardiosporidium cionae]
MSMNVSLSLSSVMHPSIVQHSYKEYYRDDRVILFHFVYLSGAATSNAIFPECPNHASATDVRQVQAGSLEVVNAHSTLFIWIGDESADLSNLCCSYPTKFEEKSAVTCFIQGNDNLGAGIAQKLSAKFQLPIYLSFSLDLSEEDLLLHIQKILLEQIGKRSMWQNRQLEKVPT